jgi:hypothetical protein
LVRFIADASGVLVLQKELMVDKYHGFFVFFASVACCHCGAESS